MKSSHQLQHHRKHRTGPVEDKFGVEKVKEKNRIFSKTEFKYFGVPGTPKAKCQVAQQQLGREWA